MAARVSRWTVWMLALALIATACGGDGTGVEATEQPSAPVDAASAAPSEARSEPPTDQGTAGVGQSYVVKSGDTLSAIAQQFDTTVARIVRANDLDDPDMIDVGQRLTIPLR